MLPLAAAKYPNSNEISCPIKKNFSKKFSKFKCGFAALIEGNGPTRYLWQLQNIQTPMKFPARKKQNFRKNFLSSNVGLPHSLKVMGQSATFGSCKISKLQ